MTDEIKRRVVTVDGAKVRYTYDVRNREVVVRSQNLTFTAESWDSAPHEIKWAIKSSQPPERTAHGCWNLTCIGTDCDGVHHVDATAATWTQERGTVYNPATDKYEAPEGMVVVRIDNSYACGRQSDEVHHVPAPALSPSGDEEDDLDEWWEEYVQPHTGDGHPCGEHEHALYKATITIAPGRPELVGQTMDWMDQ